MKTARFVDNRIAGVNVKIARAEGEIARIEMVKSEHDSLQAQAAELKTKVENLERSVANKLGVVNAMNAAEGKVAALLVEFEKLRAEGSRSELLLSQRDSELKQASDASKKIAEVRADHKRHVDALGRIKELERERDARESLRLALSKIESAIASVTADQKHLASDLESIQRSHAAIESLKRSVQDQDEFEREVERLRSEVNRLDAVSNKLKSIDEQLERLRENYKSNSAQLSEAKERSAYAEHLSVFEDRDSKLVHEIAALQAALERDEKFQNQIKNGLCPILSEKCLNLKEGQTLEMFVTSQFGELKAKIKVLEDEKVTLDTSLRASREATKYSAQISVLENRAREIADEGTRLKNERELLETEAKPLPTVKAELEDIESKLKALDNPRSKIAVLENEARREAEVREKLSKAEKNLERLESDRRIHVEQLEAYKDLDKHWAEVGQIRETTADAYKIFLANEVLANSVFEREVAFENARKTFEEVDRLAADAEKRYAEAGKGYDRERHLTERSELLDLQKRHAESNATYEAAKKRELELGAEFQRLTQIRDSMQIEFRERERLEKVAEVTDFIRGTLKEAAPLVARNYVYHVSVEANQMFREITGAAECTLKWAEDYGIVMEQDGYERPFQSLSGGEQMAAALSVRLALLKQLSDIRIAFFDEPTTNMDRERRENLAQQIGQIRHFEQLFVISHDDTFEGYMNHEIKIG